MKRVETSSVGFTVNQTEFVTMQEAARLLGVSRQTLWRRVRDGVLPVYWSEQNRRVRLVKRADVERLATPTIAAPVAQSQ
jgi:excisionase family DNA binding protein